MKRFVIVLTFASAAACSPAAPTTEVPAAMPTQKCANPAAPPAERVIRFETVAMGGVKNGQLQVTVQPSGLRAATFEFNDRGRGPKLAMHYATDPAGLPIAVDIEGTDYFKVSVDEHLKSAGDKITWKNRAEAGEDAHEKPSGFYVPFEGIPEMDAALARALIANEKHTIALLPAGQARIQKASDMMVGEGEWKIHVTRWELLGVDLTPSSVWLDDDGELFAEVSDWSSIVRRGYDGVVAKLLAEQDAAENARFENDAKTLAQAPAAAGLAIVNARIFDPEKKTTQNGTIVVKNDRIVAVGPNAKAPSGATVIDAAGKTVIPGMWDMHTHVSPINGPLDLACGVTTVRDLGNDADTVKRLRESWDTGKTVGPRVIAAGLIDGHGPFQAPTPVFADDEAQAKKEVKSYADRGYAQIKIYSSMKPALVPTLVAAAHENKMRVSGHVPSGMIAEDAVNAGFDELQHMNFVFLNFLATRDDDTRTPLRFTRVADKGASLDLSSPPVKSFIALLVKKNVTVDPTLHIFQSMFTDRAGKMPEWASSLAPRLPVAVRRRLLAGGLPVSDDAADARYKASYANMVKMVKMLFDAGVHIVPGTDDFPGVTFHDELAIYVQAGIPARDVLAMATLGAARTMKKDRDFGTISPGKMADLVIVDGKPDEKIRDLEKTATIVRGGVVYSAKDVFATVAIGAP